MKKITRKRLDISAETIRTIGTRDLLEAVGGAKHSVTGIPACGCSAEFTTCAACLPPR